MERNLSDLIYQIKNSGQKVNLFLGAGASISSGIPSARGIVDDVLSNSQNTRIKALNQNSRYVDVVSCLTALERKKMFEKYILDSHLSITYLYLAELYSLGFIEYIITTNFDDLMLKTLAIKGIHPPIYDLSTSDLETTSKPTSGAVVFLHGRHNGDWQLNTDGEMDRISPKSKTLFDKIGDNIWIVLGYSGEDKVFNALSQYSRFSNELYWIAYKDELPNSNVTKLLNTDYKQAYMIKGFDSDSFSKQLYVNLVENKAPQILCNPFTVMQNLYNAVTEIDAKIYPKESLLLGLAKSQITSVIRRFEDNTKINFDYLSTEDEYLQNDLLEIIKKESYNDGKINAIEEIIVKNHKVILFLALGEVYREWGLFLFVLTQKSMTPMYLEESIQKFEKAECYLNFFKESKAHLYSNWFTVLFELGIRTKKTEYFQKAEIISNKAIKENPEYEITYYNKGCSLIRLAQFGNQNMVLVKSRLNDAIVNFKLAIDKNDAYVDAWGNLGVAYLYLSNISDKNINEEKALNALREAFKRGSNSYNLIQLCIMKNEIDEGLNYLELIIEKDPSFILKWFPSKILDKPFDKLENNERFRKMLGF